MDAQIKEELLQQLIEKMQAIIAKDPEQADEAMAAEDVAAVPSEESTEAPVEAASEAPSAEVEPGLKEEMAAFFNPAKPAPSRAPVSLRPGAKAAPPAPAKGKPFPGKK